MRSIIISRFLMFLFSGVFATVGLTVVSVQSAEAVTARWRYEDAYINVNNGEWYRDSNNETATLAWGESYVLMSLCSMFRATGDPLYLDRLAYHLDGVLAQRDDARGVTDYRGISTACWQNTHYQTNNEPYCYVVHSGMIGYGLAEFARLVSENNMEEEKTYDGVTLGSKAADYIIAAEETVACHDDQWNSNGYYIFRQDASFLNYAGSDLPLNQSNAMGRLLLVLYEVTGETTFLEKATALAQRFASFISTGPNGEYLWNYWGGSYSAPGEDISHASINVGFAVLAARYGVVFNETDLEAFARTFVYNVYEDDHTFFDRVGGGGTNTYAVQSGRWLLLTPQRTTIYSAVRDLFEMNYPPGSVSSGSVLAGWGYLAEYEPKHCPHFFYYVDWHDPDPQNDTDWREATAYGANILTTPPELIEPCIIPLPVNITRAVTVEQWDGSAYHPTARWQPTGGETTRLVPYEPRWPHVYWNDGVLYQFADDFSLGEGIQVQETMGFSPPEITSTPPAQGLVGEPLFYTAQAIGDDPMWWSLSDFPTHARIDYETGSIDFTPETSGDYAFTVLVENDSGGDEQSFVYSVMEDNNADGGLDGSMVSDGEAIDSSSTDGGDNDTSVPDDGETSSDASPQGTSSSGGCSCHTLQNKKSHLPGKTPLDLSLIFLILVGGCFLLFKQY